MLSPEDVVVDDDAVDGGAVDCIAFDDDAVDDDVDEDTKTLPNPGSVAFTVAITAHSVLEAHACGITVVVPRAQGFVDTVQHGVS